MAVAILDRPVAPRFVTGRIHKKGNKIWAELPPGYQLAGINLVTPDGVKRIPVESNVAPFKGPDKARKLISCAKPQDGWEGLAPHKEPIDGVDPSVIGFDGALYQGVASVQYQTTATAYVASATSSPIQLPRNTFITEILLVMDPIATSGSASNLAQDPGDKYYQAMSIAGGPTYYSHSDSLTMAKPLGELNKVIYGGSIPRVDFVSGGSATQTPWAHRIHFGALNDYNPFDITAGIPAEDETALSWVVTFPANTVIAGSGQTISTSTNVYVTVIGVNGMPAGYRANCPIPDFRTDVISAVVTNSFDNLLGSRFLKRSLVLNTAATANADVARNDSNMTDFSIQILKPTTVKLMDRVRTQIARSMFGVWGARFPAVDANGASAVSPQGLTGVMVIDWRKITGNPYGLDLYNMQTGDAQYLWTMGTTTGQLTILHEYYAARNLQSLAAMRAWQGKFAFQAM